MPFRIGILDIAAAIVLLVVLFIPGRAAKVDRAYEAQDQELREIALHQARLAADPSDAESAVKLAELLTTVGQTDWAVQVAGEASQHSADSAWRALLAISIAHAERIEVGPAHEYARQALEACEALGIGPALCPASEHARLSVYHDQLEAGVRSGIDPRIDPNGFQKAVLRAVIMVRVRDGTPPPEPSDGDKDRDKGTDGDVDQDNGSDRGRDTSGQDNGSASGNP